MRKTSMLALVGVLALVASLVVGPGASAKSAKLSRTAAGTVVFIHDQEPPSMQSGWENNNLYATSLVVNNIWYGCAIYNDKAQLVPRNCTVLPQLLKKSPLTAKVTYKQTAQWSDGKPLGAKDLRATWKVYTNPKFNVNSRVGWEDIKSITGNGKVATVVFKKSYAAWRELLAGGVYPAHIIAGQDMNNLFLNSIPVSSGPWKFQSWTKGTQLAVVRNPNFKAGPKMKLDRVVFRYILDTNARFQALKANEGQIMEPQPQLQIAEFLKNSKFVVDRKQQYAWEHIDIQLGSQGHPALRKRFVRKALITGINRAQIAAALYGTIAPGLPVLNSHFFKPFEPQYRQNFGVYKFSQTKAISYLKGNGCTGGPSTPSATNQAIWSCPGVGQLSFTFSTTSGNQIRALTFEIIQRQLKSVGIELKPRFQVPGVLFGETLPSSNWDLIMFTYTGGPASNIDAGKDEFGCGGDSNYINYCNQTATKIFKRISAELDPKVRATLMNSVEARFLVPDVPSIPLYARPQFLIRAKGLTGPIANPTSEGSPWNVALWSA
jgi:peptide/nickel transport system substrate-binding protein